MHFTVSVTNLTKGISFTPFLAATHKRSLQLFNLGEPASEGIAYIAEAGDTGPLMSVLESDDSVHSIAQTEGLLGPGETVTFEIDTSGWFNRFGYFSLAAMLLPTNDTFVSLNKVVLPYIGSVSYLADAYDAGSEPNSEMCGAIPGPACGGEGLSPDEDGEGYVYPSPGIHGEGELSQAAYQWAGPVAKVTISRMY
ncbi:hypothetical protein FT643_18090 [Ketobacter sp. MCCC 1A13808]|nr:hypothetical protein [Ketobacter sp. MCCC 1A13808]RLP55171.1 MAG: hypothetical protein D6160_07550 [Ketobacter sp.]